MGTQGTAKDEATTEWFLGKKWKSTVSPAVAVIVLGLNFNSPFWPTDTECVAAETIRGDIVRVRKVVSCIVTVACLIILGRASWELMVSRGKRVWAVIEQRKDD